MEFDFQNLAENCTKGRKVWGVLGWIFVVLSCLSLLGIVVSVIWLGVAQTEDSLKYIVGASFVGGILLFGGVAYLCMTRANALEKLQNEYRERAKGEECFLVGENTFAFFSEKTLVIEGENQGKKRKIAVPYSEMKFFTMKSRFRPQERGENSILFEIPARYLNPSSKQEKVYIQLDAKERLFACLEKYSLPLFGEDLKKEVKNTKFQQKKKFTSPYPDKRKKAIITLCAGGILLVGGIVGAIFLRDLITAFAVVAFFGIYALSRGVVQFLKAKYTVAIYGEGIFWKSGITSERVFLKWEEMECISKEDTEEGQFILLHCAYGEYQIPAMIGLYDYLNECGFITVK